MGSRSAAGTTSRSGGELEVQLAHGWQNASRAPAARSASMLTAPVAIPTPTMLAARAARMSHVASPAYQQRLRRQVELFGRVQQQVGRGLCLRHVAAVDDRRRSRQAKRLDGRGHLLPAARRRDGPRRRPRHPAPAAAQRRPAAAGIPVELAEDLAGPTIDGLRAVVAQPPIADGRDLHRQALAVGADQARQRACARRESRSRQTSASRLRCEC